MGCLLVYEGRVLGEGRNEVNETKNVSEGLGGPRGGWGGSGGGGGVALCLPSCPSWHPGAAAALPGAPCTEKFFPMPC